MNERKKEVAGLIGQRPRNWTYKAMIFGRGAGS